MATVKAGGKEKSERKRRQREHAAQCGGYEVRQEGRLPKERHETLGDAGRDGQGVALGEMPTAALQSGSVRAGRALRDKV